MNLFWSLVATDPKNPGQSIGVQIFVRSTFLPVVVACFACLSGCGSTPEVVLNISTVPAGAQVYLSRRGEKAYKGKLGPVKGDMRAEPIVEDFMLLGTSPIEYTTPLEEREGGAAIFGVLVVRRYGDGVVRVVKEGFATIERHIRFKDGEVQVNVKLEADPPAN